MENNSNGNVVISFYFIEIPPARINSLYFVHSSVEKLLQHFHTLSRIRRASEKELAELIGHQRALAVLHYFAANTSGMETASGSASDQTEKDL